MKRLYLAAMSAMAVFVVMAAASISARADTVYSDFGPGQSYNNYYGYQIKACYLCGTEVAASFTPSANYTLSQIDIALMWGGLANNEAKVELVDSSSGLPGTTVLESWNLSNLPYEGSGAAPDSLLSSGGVTLSSGTQYWVVANPAASGFDVWNETDASHFGGFAKGFEGIDGGYSWSTYGVDSSYTPAFDVLGAQPTATPEASTLTLLSVMGLVGLAWAARRNRPAMGNVQ